MLFRTHRPKVYLEIATSHILLGLLRQRKGSTYCEVFDQQSFYSLEVMKCGIYNTSAIYTFIKKVADKHSLQGSQAIVCCPYFEGCSQERKKLATFQVALCVCKAGLKIESLYEERMFFR